MLRQYSSRLAFFLVEGDSEVNLWTAWSHEECHLVGSGGKSNVIGAIERLDARNFKGALGLVDFDYEISDMEEMSSQNLVVLDAHDLECWLCRSDALVRVLREYGDSAKIASFEEDDGVDVRQGLVNRALPFGQVRLVAKKRAVRPQINVPRFVDRSKWRVHLDQLVEANASHLSMSKDELREEMEECARYDPWIVCHGNDMINILRIGLAEVLGNGRTNVSPGDLSANLRLAARRDALKDTRPWRGIEAWESANRPFLILRSREGDGGGHSDGN